MANLNFNRVIMAGRLCGDPELKTTQSGVSVCTVNVAVNRPYSKDNAEKQADFFTATFWRTNAETLSKFFRKGSSVMFEGALQTRTWEKDGQKHYATEILVDRLYFVDSKNEAGAVYSPAGQTNAVHANTYIPQDYVAPQAPTEVLEDGEELPF
jgi:single-strand DNA-binding protein